MKWFILYAAMKFSFIPNGDYYHMNMDETIIDRQDYSMTVEMELSFYKDMFFIGGNIFIPMYSNGEISFSPTSLGSLFYAGIRYKFIEIGYSHYCEHPINIWQASLPTNYEFAYDEIYIQLNMQIEF